MKIQQQENINVSKYKAGMYFIKTNLGDTASFLKQ